MRVYRSSASATSLRYSLSAREGLTGEPSRYHASAGLPCSQSRISTRNAVPGRSPPIEWRIRRLGPISASVRVAA